MTAGQAIASQVVVLGAGVAGLLACHAIAPFARHVVVVDRDRLPDGPRDRKGVPQARHTHGLVSSGALAVDALVPGALSRLYRRGAQHIGIPSRYLSMGPHGWLPRGQESEFIVGCGRALLEWELRTRLAERENVEFVESTDVTGLSGTEAAVDGVHLRERPGGRSRYLPASLVVDATGRTSRCADWLAGLGLPAVGETVVDPKVVYATRRYRAPEAVRHGFPAISVEASPRAPGTRRSGYLLPIEDGQWSVTLVGVDGAAPPVDEAGFAEFARTLRHPAIADLIAGAEPLGPPFGFHAPPNLRRHLDALPLWPKGFVVIGDAHATFNPVYGHGMAVAAKNALLLRDHLKRGWQPSTARRAQRAISRCGDSAWYLATGFDLRFRDTVGERPVRGLAARVADAYFDRMIRTAPSRQEILNAALSVYALRAGITRLIAPDVVLATLRGPVRSATPEPPLTSAELAVVWRRAG